jgi:hypothetical protein
MAMFELHGEDCVWRQGWELVNEGKASVCSRLNLRKGLVSTGMVIRCASLIEAGKACGLLRLVARCDSPSWKGGASRGLQRRRGGLSAELSWQTEGSMSGLGKIFLGVGIFQTCLTVTHKETSLAAKAFAVVQNGRLIRALAAAWPKASGSK